MKAFLLLMTLIVMSSAFATPAGIKNEDGTFKITPTAMKTMGIEFFKISKNGPWILPKESLVKIKFTQGVYRKFDNDITFVIVKVLKSDQTTITISSADIEVGDEIAIKGANFLRLAEADLNSDTVDNCAH